MTGQYEPDFRDEDELGLLDFGALRVDDVDEILTSEEPEMPEPEAEAIDPKFITTNTRPVGAIAYEKKMRKLVNGGIRLTVASPATVPDAAQLVLSGPKLAEKMGNLAATNDRVARGIDMLTEGTENPVLAAVAVSLPLILQLLRNHEPQIEPSMRGIRIPFLKRTIRMRLGIKLGRARAFTNEPDALSAYVFNHPGIAAAFQKQGIPLPDLTRKSRRRRTRD